MLSQDGRHTPDELVAYAAVFCVAIAGNALVALAPLFVGGMIDHWGMTESDVGALLSYEFLGTSVATVLGAFVLHRPNWPLRTTAFGALAVLALGNLLTPFIHQHHWLLVATRVVCGFCGGLAWIVSATAIAQLRNNRHALALFYGSPFFTGMIFQPAMPKLFAAWGVDGGFFMLAGGAALCFLLRGRYLAHGRASDTTTRAMTGMRGGGLVPLALVLTAFTAQFVANTGLSVYFERIGVGAGHSLQATAFVLSAALAFAVAGAVVASVVAERLKPLPAIALSTVVICAASALVLRSESLLWFAVAAGLFNLVITFVTPFYFIVLEQVADPARSALLGNIAMTVGFSAGPLLIGATVTDAGYLVPVIATVALFALSLALVFVFSMSRSWISQPQPEETRS